MNNLIIAAADGVNADGLLALRMYCNTALNNGKTDIMFILNYPGYYHSKNNTSLFLTGILLQ